MYAPRALTTAGIPASRSKIDAWLSSPPSSVTTAANRESWIGRVDWLRGDRVKSA